MSQRRAFLGSMIRGATGAVVAATGTAATGRVLESNERIRFGLIGGGSRGKEIFRAALRCPDVEAVAVADIYTRRLEEARAIVPGIATFKDHRALCAGSGWACLLWWIGAGTCPGPSSFPRRCSSLALRSLPSSSFWPRHGYRASLRARTARTRSQPPRTRSIDGTGPMCLARFSSGPRAWQVSSRSYGSTACRRRSLTYWWASRAGMGRRCCGALSSTTRMAPGRSQRWPTEI